MIPGSDFRVQVLVLVRLSQSIMGCIGWHAIYPPFAYPGKQQIPKLESRKQTRKETKKHNSRDPGAGEVNGVPRGCKH